MIPDFKSIIDLLRAFPDEQSCISHLENLRWHGNPVSPFNAESKVYKCAGNKYKCKETGKYFNVRTNTVFDNTKIPLQKWFLALYVFSSHKKGISSHQLARDISVTQKSAWFLLHRLRYAFDHPNFNKPLNGTVEVDECFIGGKTSNKHASKVNRTAQGGAINEHTPVLGMKERDGIVIAKVVKSRERNVLTPIIYDTVAKKSTVYTDEYRGYSKMKYRYNHASVNHGAKQYVNGMAHTNGIENFWSHLKRGIDGIYHWVSVSHLQSYVDEFTLRFNTRDLKTQSRFDLILAGIAGKRLTYQDLIK